MAEIRNQGRIRVLHTADLHLDRQFSSWGDAASVRQQDLLDTLEQIGDLVRKYRAGLMLLAGDQFDRHNPSKVVVERFRAWLGRLGQDGVQVALISGNHDSYWYEDSVYREQLPPNVTVFREPACENPVSLTVGGIPISVYGIAHDHTQERDILPGFRRRAQDGVHIGLLHATVDPPADFAVQDRYLPLSSQELAETGLDYIALGHIHRSRVINAGGPGMAMYPGSPEPLSITETGERSVTLLEFAGGAPRYATLPCGQRTVVRQQIDCSGLNVDQIVEQIASNSDEAVIFHAVLRGAPNELPDVDRIQSRLAGRFCHVRVSDSTSVVDSGFVRAIEQERTIRGRFVQRLRSSIANAGSDHERAVTEMALRVGLIALQKRSGR